jgi:hypothetical protein
VRLAWNASPSVGNRSGASRPVVRLRAQDDGWNVVTEALSPFDTMMMQVAEIRIEGKCNPSVRFDGSLLTISDDLRHLHAYELTHGEQVRDLNL